MTQKTVEDLELFAATSKKLTFTTANIAKALGVSEGSARALLANSTRRLGPIESVSPGVWRYNARKYEKTASLSPLEEEVQALASKARKVFGENTKAEAILASARRATKDTEDVALKGLEALDTLNGSGHKVVALYLVRKAMANPNRLVSYDIVLPIRGIGFPESEEAKVRREVGRLLSLAFDEFCMPYSIHANGFEVSFDKPIEDWRPNVVD